jgi:hypothetical protein
VRIVIGAVLGGLAMFAWSAVSHMALPLGTAGIRAMPADREPAVVEAMRDAMTERAIYFLPGLDMSRRPTEEEEKAWQARLQAGPTAIVAYNPRGGQPMGTGQLVTELLLDIAACLFAAVVLAHVPSSVGYLRRALMVAAFGAFATLAIDGSYWNWYSFPGVYFLAQAVDGVVGGALAGLAVARVVKA